MERIIYEILKIWDALGNPGCRLGLQQPPRDDFFHDFGGAAVDAHHPRIRPEARDRVFGHVAVAAKQLQAGIGHAAKHFGGVQLQGTGGFGRELAALVGGDAGVQKSLRSGHFGGALGQGEAGVLELGQRLAKGLALLHVAQRGVEGTLGPVHGLHADDQALAWQLAHHLREALAFDAAQQRIGWHAQVVEEQLGGVARVLADFFQVLPAREAGGLRIDQEQAHALGTAGRVGLGGQHDQVAVLAVADENFAAVDDVAIALFAGGGANGLQVAARARFGHANGPHRCAADQARQPMLALGFGAAVQQVGGNDVAVHFQPADQPTVAPAGQHFDDGKRKMHVGPAAAVLLGHIGAQVAVVAHFQKQLARHDAGFFPGAVMGFDLGVAKALQSIGEQGQLGLGIGSQQGIGQHGMIKIRAVSAYQ